MTTFETKHNIEISENFQGISLTEFNFVVDTQMSNDQIVDTFIGTKLFSYDSLQDSIKKEPDKGFLRRAFDIEKLKISDFKKTDKEGTSKFLLDIINEPDWGDDRNDFAKLLDRFFEIHNTFAEGDFYIISKDWFDKDDEKAIEPESWVYIYYFLIISVDRSSNVLTLSEWTYD